MKKTNSAVGLMVLAWGSLASAQTAQPPAAQPATDNTELGYIGGSMRLGLGYDEKTRLRGEMYKVLSESETKAILGEAWVSRNAGGLKLSYNFIPAAKVRSIDPQVIKTFIAADRNTDGDAKATIGAGLERQSWFAGVYGSAAITRRREISNTTTQSITTIQGNDGRPYLQDITTLTSTRTWERPYDWGVGARFGRFWESALVRVTLGADYEWGRDSAKQTTFSLGVEKFFYNSPISLALNVEHYRKSGGIDTTTNDNRVMAMLRYDFGGPNFRPSREYKMVEVQTTRPAPIPAPTPAPAPVQPVAAAPAAPAVAAPAPQPRREKRLVKTTATMASEEFFEFDRSTLTATARDSLDKIVEQLKATGFTGNLHLVGHTCNIGSAAYNQRLSERRANAVKKYLVDKGGINADVIVAEGKGLTEPKYPNTNAERHKNRRVDLEFVTYEDKIEEVVVPVPPAPAPAPAPAPVATPAPKPAPLPPVAAVEWKREVIDTEPAWLRRALRQSIPHKMTVDTYRQKEVTTSSTTGDKRYINSPPVAANDTFSVAFGSSGNILNVLANDSDPDNDPLTITAVSTPAHGTASISAGRISYTPAATYQGADSFTYTISDGQGHTATATVAVTVQAPTNRAPTAVNDEFTVAFNSSANSFNVLANDTDPDNDTLTITAVSTPAHGNASISSGRILYSPSTNYQGTDTFTYTISDGQNHTATATVTVTVQAPTNRSPVAATDAFTVAQNSTSNVFDVLANDSDPDGDPITLTAVGAPQHGTTAVSNGKVVYVPTSGYNGTDRFIYTISDGKGGTAIGTVNVTVTPATANNPPVANKDAFTVDQNSTNNSLNVLANDTDPDNDTLTITGVTAPAHGTAAVVNNRVTYTPTSGYTGLDTFNYTISDGKGGTATASVSITVQAASANRAPTPKNDTFTVNTNSTNNSLDVLANDTDPDGDALSISGTTSPAHGTALVLNNKVLYTPTAGYSGSDTFNYTVTDGKGLTGTATVTITVGATNRAPIAVNDSFQITQGVTSLDVLANDSDPDGDALTITAVTQPSVGSVAIATGGKTLTFNKPTTFNTTSFTYTISDGKGGSATGTVTLTDP